MSQVITNAFATYWQECLTNETPVVLDTFVLANIPDLDPDAPISPDEGLPPAAQIVHRQAVDQRGRINLDAVAYTIVMDTSVGDFEFNAMYLINTEADLVGMVVHKGLESKLKTDEATGQTGNSLVKSMLMEYDRASDATVTTVDASTWQIDYAARLRGIDDDMRRLGLPLYGSAWFDGDGFLVFNNADVIHVKPGTAVVGGLLAILADDHIVTPSALPMGVWVDVCRRGSLLGAWENQVTLVLSDTALMDYTDEGGYQHHVAQLATVNADSSVTDTRRQRTHAHYWDELVDPPSAADLGGLPQEAYRPRTDSLNNQQGEIEVIRNKDMNTCVAGEFGLYETATCDHSPSGAGEMFYCETKSIYGTSGLIQLAYPSGGEGILAWRNFTQTSSTWDDVWREAYDTGNKPTPDEIGAAAAVHSHPWSQVEAPARVKGEYGEIIPEGEYNQLLSQSGFFNNSGGLGAYGDPFPGQWSYLFHNSHGNESGFCGSLAMNFGATGLRYGAISAGAGTGWKKVFTENEPPTPAEVGAAPAVHGHTPEECGAAPVAHGHTPDQCGAAPEVHGHDWSQIANIPPLGRNLLGDGGGTPEVLIGAANLGIITVSMLRYGRVYPITFHVVSGQVAMINRGGENADHDYDLVLECHYDDWSLYLRAVANIDGIGQVFG